MAGKYAIIEQPNGSGVLTRYGEEVGTPNNAEHQFWCEREAFRQAYELLAADITIPSFHRDRIAEMFRDANLID